MKKSSRLIIFWMILLMGMFVFITLMDVHYGNKSLKKATQNFEENKVYKMAMFFQKNPNKNLYEWYLEVFPNNDRYFIVARQRTFFIR